MGRWMALGCIVLASHGLAGTARLTDAGPLAGVWWNPDQPGTALLWDQGAASAVGASAVLEYDASGWPVWLDYRTQPLVWRDSTTLRPDRGYAMVLGELGWIEAECASRCISGATVQARHTQGAAQLEFLDNRHAIWIRNGERIPLQHYAPDAHRGIDPQQTDDLLLFARGPATEGRSAVAVVRLQSTADGHWDLQCLDCAPDAPAGLHTRRLSRAAVQSLQLRHSPQDRNEVRWATHGEVNAWLHLPYRDRTHALSTQANAPLEEVRLVPVGRGFKWREGGFSAVPVPQYPVTLFSRVEGRDSIGRRSDGLLRFAAFDRSLLLILHDGLRAPRWYMSFPLGSVACGSLGGMGECLGMQRGRGQLGQQVSLLEPTTATFEHRYITEFTGRTLIVQPTPPSPWPDPDRELLYTPDRLAEYPAEDIGVLVVRMASAELRGVVQRTVTRINPTLTEIRMRCVACSQSGIPGDAAQAEAALTTFVRHYVVTVLAPSPFDTGQLPVGDRFFHYGGLSGARGGEMHWVWSGARRGPDGVNLPPDDPAVPMWIHYFPLPD